MYKYRLMTLTQLGSLFGTTSHQVGKWLVEIGLRTTKGKPFSELFHQSRFVVNLACEPNMEDAPATFIRRDANFDLRFAYLPDDPRTTTVRGDHEGITPIVSLGAVRLRDGAETPAVIRSRMFQNGEAVINGHPWGERGRRGKPVILTVDAGRMHKEGHKFWLSENGVSLTDVVPRGYLSRM